MDSDELREVNCDDECQSVRWKAADEIERLRAGIARVHELVKAGRYQAADVELGALGDE